MKKLKVLNLYAGIGGNRKLWENVEVTAVEIDQKIAKVYKGLCPGDEVIAGDAREYLPAHFEECDFIWASPCQTHSRMNYIHRRYPDLSLYELIIFLQRFFKGSWVVENVKPYYKPLIPPGQVLRNCVHPVIGKHMFDLVKSKRQCTER